MAGLVPAIHEIRRIERPKVSNKAKSFAIARPRQYENSLLRRHRMDGRDNPRIKSRDGHDAPGAQRRDRQRRRPTPSAIRAPVILLITGIDRDRGTPRDATPPTPPGIRVPYHGGSTELGLGGRIDSGKTERLEIVVA